MKRILAATALTLLAVPATACGSGDGDSGGKNRIVFSYWGSDSRQKLTEAAIAKFEAKNPGIDVEGDFSDWDSYYEKLATKTAAGDAPDVMSIEIRGLAEYAGRGTLADLTGKVNTADLDQSVLKA
ncbi:extracellular solute-binding protein [Actinomadura luteofluorescens]